MPGELIFNEVSATPPAQSAKDALFATASGHALTGATPRIARVAADGTVYFSQELFIISNSADFALANATGAQKAFGAPTAGALTLPGAIAIEFEAVYVITSTGVTSHQWQVLFGGTATLTSGAMLAQAVSSTSAAVAAVSQGWTSTLGTAFTVTAASVSATENVTINLRGVARINVGGTFIPQVALTVAPGAAPTMKANSFFRCTPFGSNTATSLGNWA